MEWCSKNMFDILYQCNDFIIINKYPGVSVHKDDNNIMLLREVAKVIQHEQLFLVHRLDKITSGILLLAKNAAAASQLSQQFAERLVEKYYLAITTNKPKKKQGAVIGDMERSRRASWKLTSGRANPAITQFFSMAGESGERLFLCKPHTGKTHQIRVALKSLGCAILGDPVYNTASVTDRGYLHAYAIRFTYAGAQYQFICSPSYGEKWHSLEAQRAIEQWRDPWVLKWPKIK